jgi:phage shock protein PspC (stress-responsive transcriptional regulator)
MSSEAGVPQRPAVRVTRNRQDGLLGGVCAGLPNLLGPGTNWLRCAFVVAALCGGIGVVVYLACWLVIPADDQQELDAVRSVVLLAWATGALVALVLVAAAAAAATVFGLGWIVFALAAIIVGVVFSPLYTRIPQAAALAIVAALTLPAVAVALTSIRLTPQTGASVQHPATSEAMERSVYRSGLGTLLVDLRHTSLPRSGVVGLRIRAGVRRTIVALPADECVHVRVNYDVHMFPAKLLALLSGRQQTGFNAIVLFGSVYSAYRVGTANRPQGVAVTPTEGSGPLLVIDFSSQGGGLYVRDYPDSIDPDTAPNWPGFRVTLEPKPSLQGEPSEARKQMLREWHRRRRAQLASQQEINAQMPGPCAS